MEQRDHKYTTDEITVSVAGLRLVVGFMTRAIKRHRRLALITFACTMVIALITLMFMPPLYRVQTRILTHTSYIIPALASPGRSIPWQAQSATQGAVEIIGSRDNLSGIVDETGLVEVWEATRTRRGIFLDSIRDAIFGELSYDDKRQALMSVLEDRFDAHVEDDQTIVMTLEWHDPGTALRILDTAQKRFLDGRRNSELSEINETVAILERTIVAAQPTVQRAADRLRETVMRTTGRTLPRIQPDGSTGSRAQRPAADAREEGFEAALAEKRAEIDRLEDAYRTGLTRAQDELNRLRNSLGPSHPDVANATRNLETASLPPDDLARLKSEEARLAMQLNRLVLSAPGTGIALSRPGPITEREVPRDAPNPELEQASAEYERAAAAQSDLLDRLDNARIEVQTATAAFNYRYIITQPPVFPRKAVKPQKAMFIVGALIAALFLAIFVAIAADVVSGRIVEAWQVPRFIGIPLLGEVEATAATKISGRKAS